jgi:flagellar protein FliL
MADTPTDAPAPQPKKKSGLLIKLIVGLVVLGTAGGGAAWWFLGSKAEAKSEPALEERGLVTFDTFLVNLADEGGNRFLKANIQLVVESAERAKHIQETPVLASHLRSAMLELLTEQSAPKLVTAEGKEALKKSIKEHVAPILGGEKVVDVLFSEFVVQF